MEFWMALVLKPTNNSTRTMKALFFVNQCQLTKWLECTMDGFLLMTGRSNQIFNFVAHARKKKSFWIFIKHSAVFGELRSSSNVWTSDMFSPKIVDILKRKKWRRNCLIWCDSQSVSGTSTSVTNEKFAEIHQFRTWQVDGEQEKFTSFWTNMCTGE